MLARSCGAAAARLRVAGRKALGRRKGFADVVVAYVGAAARLRRVAGVFLAHPNTATAIALEVAAIGICSTRGHHRPTIRAATRGTALGAWPTRAALGRAVIAAALTPVHGAVYAAVCCLLGLEIDTAACERDYKEPA